MLITFMTHTSRCAAVQKAKKEHAVLIEVEEKYPALNEAVGLGSRL